MREATTVFVRLPPDVAAALQDQDIDLVARLREEGLDVARGAAADPTAPAGAKDAGFVIMAAGGAAYLAGLAIVRIIRAVVSRPVVGELGELKPVVDEHGHPLRDAAGNPLTYWSKQKQVLDPELVDRGGATHVAIPNMLEISVRDR